MTMIQDKLIMQNRIKKGTWKEKEKKKAPRQNHEH